MKIVFYSGAFASNTYLQGRIICPLAMYMMLQGHDVHYEEDINNIRKSKVLAYHDDLNVETIAKLKNNGNIIFAFDINDHSWLSYFYHSKPEALNIDYIFKSSGIQQKDSYEIYIDNEFNITKKIRPFAPEHIQAIYSRFVEEDRIFPMPHLHWHEYKVTSHKSFDQRDNKTLVRGGHHFYRVILFLKLLLEGRVDGASGFAVRSYAENYCTECENRLKAIGIFVGNYREIQCSNSIEGWNSGQLPDNFFNINTGKWNNRCSPMYFRLIELFQKCQGTIDMNTVNMAFNSSMLPVEYFYGLLGNVRFASDYKWIYSINLPPRFWEAAQAKTINYLPRRTNDQKYFPHVEDGEHYLTFDDDMSDFSLMDRVTKEQYNHITNNLHNVFMQWIEPNDPDFKCNTNLLQHLSNIIDTSNGIN